MSFVQIALLSPPYTTLTYRMPTYLQNVILEIGMRVAVPLGNSTFRVGIILSIDAYAPKNLPLGIELRSFVWLMERKSLLSQKYMDMIRQLALRQLVTEGNILGHVLPSGMRTTKNIRVRHFQKSGKPRFYKLRELGALSEDELLELGSAYTSGQADVLALAEDTALSECIQLNTDPPWIVRPNAHKQREILDFLMDNGDITRRHFVQKLPDHTAALNTLLKHNLVKVQAMSDEMLENAENSLLGTMNEFLPPPMPLFALNQDQQRVFDSLQDVLTEKKFHTSLLYGVTGSGKTALYLELARHCMEQGRSVLLLAPEVAIALKLRQDAKARNMQVSLYHGYQSQKSRENLFRACACTDTVENVCVVQKNILQDCLVQKRLNEANVLHSDKTNVLNTLENHHRNQEEQTKQNFNKQEASKQEARLIVGTRSALFLPINNLGLIILDEEHDDSFKQDEGLSYHAKDIAWYRMQQAEGLFLMGSATPDIKSFYASEKKHYPRVEMPNRIGSALLPEIKLVNIKECKESLAPESIIALKKCIERGDQAMIMLNRRGYAPLLYCLDCNSVARCPHCDIALAYHKKRGHMTCHYCGYSRPYPSPCTVCKGLHFLPLGEGTERLEEDLQNILTFEEKVDTKILRLDRDSTRREGRMEEILNAFAREEAQILVGTQMLSKGHHFPNVTLALIADADLGLNFPDYRAAERTFQLLTQASGRAGRGEKKGSVIIQTRDTDHYCWEFVKQGNFDAFYAHEIALREKLSYPPFVRLALVRASYPFIQTVQSTEKSTQNYARPHKSQSSQEAQILWADFVKRLKTLGVEQAIKVMGPSPAPIALLKGRFRFQCLIKGQNWNSIRQIFSSSLPKEKFLKKNDLRISLDIDPVNML